MSDQAGQGTEVTLPSDKIAGGKNNFINNRPFAIGTYIRGQIVALLLVLAGVGTADAGNTGNATFTALSIVLNAKGKAGVYVITWLTATTYAVVDPDGNEIGAGDIASGFSSVQLDFGITVGGTPMVAGDIHYVTVAVSDSYLTTLVTTADDSTAKAAAIVGADIVLAAAGAAPIVTGDFQREGVENVMAALTTPVTVTDEMIADLDAVGCHLKRK